MDLSDLIGRIYEAIDNDEEINIGIRVYNGEVYYGILFHDFLLDPIYLGVAPDNFLDELHNILISEFEDIITPMTVHTTGEDFTYYLTIDEIYIQFPKDVNWIIKRMRQNEDTALGSR